MRIRSLKPELLEDEVTARLSHLEWRLFISLILLADDYGNLRAVPERIRGVAMWGTAETGESLAKALETLASHDIGLVKIYHKDGQQYAHICGWSKHQKVDHPGKPTCPGPDFSDDSREPRETVALDQDLDQDQDQDHDQTERKEKVKVEVGGTPSWDLMECWQATASLWKEAPQWKDKQGKVDSVDSAYKSFAKKINEKNWPKFFKHLGWEVTKRFTEKKAGCPLYTFVNGDWEAVTPPTKVSTVGKYDKPLLPADA